MTSQRARGVQWRASILGPRLHLQPALHLIFPIPLPPSSQNKVRAAKYA